MVPLFDTKIPLEPLQAAILRVQLPHVDAWCDGRRAAGRHYEEAGLGELVPLPTMPPGTDPAWHLYVILQARADALQAAGIGQKAYYRVPSHLQVAMSDYAPDRELPGTTVAAREHLAIPMSPVLTAEQAADTVAVRDAGLD